MAEMDATQQTPKQKKKTQQKREQRVKVEGKARLELFSEWIYGLELRGYKIIRRIGGSVDQKLAMRNCLVQLIVGYCLKWESVYDLGEDAELGYLKLVELFRGA
eukprot:scaffold5423_cov69-Cyclotella_meneghiniana.AAC.1